MSNDGWICGRIQDKVQIRAFARNDAPGAGDRAGIQRVPVGRNVPPGSALESPIVRLRFACAAHHLRVANVNSIAAFTCEWGIGVGLAAARAVELTGHDNIRAVRTFAKCWPLIVNGEILERSLLNDA